MIQQQKMWDSDMPYVTLVICTSCIWNLVHEKCGISQPCNWWIDSDADELNWNWNSIQNTYQTNQNNVKG